MNGLFKTLVRVSDILDGIGAAALTFMMLLTVADILMRIGGRPIVGTYEIVGLSLALVIGFSIPRVSLEKGHVYMEFLVDKFSQRNKAVMETFTRLLCIGLFILIGYNLFAVANELHASGEVSPTIKLPFFPVAYGIGVCCFLECFVFAFDIVKIWGGSHE